MVAGRAPSPNRSCFGRPRNQPWGLPSDYPAPALLFANQEAHRVASKPYAKAFSYRLFGYQQSTSQTYFGFQRDTLYIRYDDLVLKFDNTEEPDTFPKAILRIKSKCGKC